jgi:chromosome segregation ATPase
MPRKQTKQARADVLANELSDLAGQVEDLKQEVDDWRDALCEPDEMKHSNIYQTIDQCADELDEIMAAVSEGADRLSAMEWPS